MQVTKLSMAQRLKVWKVAEVTSEQAQNIDQLILIVSIVTSLSRNFMLNLATIGAGHCEPNLSH